MRSKSSPPVVCFSLLTAVCLFMLASGPWLMLIFGCALADSGREKLVGGLGISFFIATGCVLMASYWMGREQHRKGLCAVGAALTLLIGWIFVI